MLKKSLYISIVAAMLTAPAVAKHGKGHHGKHNQQSTTSSTITTQEEEGLVFMVEEEKLARDVYLTLNEKWHARVFENISKSEQRHMDSVENLLNKYQIDVPSTLNDIGHFEDEKLQGLYNDLIAKGEQSYVDALEVGVIIEETDITDLEELIDGGLSSDTERVYENLLSGSFNHLSAFNKEISKQ